VSITKRAVRAFVRRLVRLAGGRAATVMLAACHPFGLANRAGRVLLREGERRRRAGEQERAGALARALLRSADISGAPRAWAAKQLVTLADAHQRAKRWEEAADVYRELWLAESPSSQSDGGVVAPPTRNGELTGWIPADFTDDGTVLFKLNGVVVADTRATQQITLPGGARYLQLQRKLKDLWSYCGAGDVLEVEHAARPLHIVGSGRQYAFDGTKGRSGELFALLHEGHVLNSKYGRLTRSIQHDHEWQSMVLELFGQVRKEIGERFDLQLIPFYGTLLGAVRERNFIGHDNDFDTVYISGHSSPEAVREEFRAVCDFLVDRGYSLRVMKTHTWVRMAGTGPKRDSPHSPMSKIDIFFAWFDEDGFFQISYGHHGEAIKKSDEFFKLRTERLGVGEVPVPSNAEDILAQLYGPQWRRPDPGFTHFSWTRVLHREFQLGVGEANEAHWRQFYRDHRIVGASSFARFVAERLPAGCGVLDIGCGTGRDAVFFAQRGHPVVGADLSAEAVERAREAAREARVERVWFERLDASSRPDLDRLVAGLPAAEQLVVYLRFLLHSVDEATEDALLAGLVDALPGGFRLATEFRTTRDGKLPKAYGDHYRRYIDEQALADKLLHRWGFEIEHLEAGRGLSPYQREDPHLARIIARRH
jgi:SAM-dependent methyltransferase